VLADGALSSSHFSSHLGCRPDDSQTGRRVRVVAVGFGDSQRDYERGLVCDVEWEAAGNGDSQGVPVLL